jgi:autotransporter-associated beta strand protein
VTLDGASPSLADVTFTSTSSQTIAQGSGGSLQLANGTGSATLTVSAGTATISAPVALASNVVVLPAAGAELTISGGISGDEPASASLTVNAPGTVVLSGANSYTGGTVVSAGTLVLASSSALAEGSSLTVGADSSLFSADHGTMAPVVDAAPSAVVATTSVASNIASAATIVDTSATAAVPSAANPVVNREIAPPPLPKVRTVPPALPRAPAVDRIVWSSTPSPRPRPWVHGARHGARPLRAPTEGWSGEGSWAWLGQTANGLDANHKKDAAILALDAVFAQYGR